MKKLPKHRSVKAKALELPVFRARIVPNKKRALNTKHKKKLFERENVRSELYLNPKFKGQMHETSALS